jgi:hypothetical protein
MWRRVIDADVTVTVALTVSLADAESGTRRQRRFAGDQPTNDSEPGTAAGNRHAPERRAFWRRAGAAVEQ